MWLTFFIVSSLINIILMFYVRWLLKNIVIVDEDVESLSLLISDFSQHLNSVHELEMFYGDETLGALMELAKKLSEKLSEIDLILSEDEDLEIEREVDSNATPS